jgi:two-component system sensor histidine kinase KdpD
VLTHANPIERLLAKVRENFALTSVTLLEKQDGVWQCVATSGEHPCADPDEADVDIAVTADVHLTLRGRALPAADRRVLEAVAGQALLALRQQRMAAAAARAERKAEATELRTTLLSAVGHDLRTPLTSIKASIGSLRAADLDLSEEDTAELMEAIELSADRLAGLIDNLLDSSRLATGAVRPHLRPVGYDEVVAHALSTVDNSDDVVVAIDDDELPSVLADPGLLERVVANVLDNALRHGAAPVSARASAHSGQVELRIVDHGKGLRKGAADSAFAPFQRLGGDRDTTPGVGLGLSVAKGFTEAMGGTIRAESRGPGNGATFAFTLPAA